MALSYVKVFVLKLNMLTQGLVHLMLRVFFSVHSDNQSHNTDRKQVCPSTTAKNYNVG